MRPPWPLQFSTLNICLISFSPNRYAIRSLAADMLFNSMKYAIRSQTKPPPLREVFSYSPCAGVGSTSLRSNVYIVGGLHPDSFMKNPTPMNNVSYFDGRNSGKTVFTYNTSPRLLPSTIVPDMISPKTTPLVLAVNVGEEERLYVLSDNMYPRNRPPVFECYTFSTNSWEQLDTPPFLNPNTQSFDPCRYYSYASAVIGTSICVSTDRTSFKFDIEKKIWEPCTLFEPDADDADRPHCGPPFRFIGNAVLFEDDVLICRTPNVRGGVTAYKIKGGEVVDSQSLIMSQGYELPDAQSSCIADFGNGLFCQVFTTDYDEPPSILTVKPFFIKKKTVLKPGDFLHCEVINEFEYVEKDTEGWYPIYCFSS